jgi:SAM-dependent methyltransferase
MGIPGGVARLLLGEARRQPFRGSLLQLGRMAVYCSMGDLRQWAAAQGVALADVEPRASHDPQLAAAGCIDDHTLFRALGFDEVRSLDVSDWEGADYLGDLNQPLPAELEGRFDVIFEAGTSQHVFHLPNLLANVHRLLKPDGRAIHAMVTSNNHVDHGFYMFSPTLFHDYYQANGYRLDASYFFEFVPFWFRGRFFTSRFTVYAYIPGCLDHLAYGGFGGRQVACFFAATKTAAARADVSPQQSYFTRFWPAAESERRARPAPPAVPAAVLERAGLPAAWWPGYLWKRLRRWLRPLQGRRMPPVVARY